MLMYFNTKYNFTTLLRNPQERIPARVISCHFPKASRTQENVCYLGSLTVLTLHCYTALTANSQAFPVPPTPRTYDVKPISQVQVGMRLSQGYSCADTFLQSTRESLLLSSTAWKGAAAPCTSTSPNPSQHFTNLWRTLLASVKDRRWFSSKMHILEATLFFLQLYLKL